MFCGFDVKIGYLNTVETGEKYFENTHVNLLDD
jgi:hypothetical protein